MPLAHEVEGYFRPALFALFGAAAFSAGDHVHERREPAAGARHRPRARGRRARRDRREPRPADPGNFSPRACCSPSRDGSGRRGRRRGRPADGGGVAIRPAARLPQRRRRRAGAALCRCAVAALTTVAFGVVPAILMARGDVQRPLKESGRGGSRRRSAASRAARCARGRGDRPRRDAAGRRGAARPRVPAPPQQDPGFHPARTVEVSLSCRTIRDFRRSPTSTRLLTSIRAQPGVTDAGATTSCRSTPAGACRYLVNGRPQPAETTCRRRSSTRGRGLLPHDWRAAPERPLLRRTRHGGRARRGDHQRSVRRAENGRTTIRMSTR